MVVGGPSRRRAPDVEERLVDADLLDQRRDVRERVHHRRRDLPVGRQVRRDDDRLRAHPPRHRHRHRRVHTERAGLVGGREHDRPLLAADDDRPSAQLWPASQLDRGEEGIHVDVQDRAAVLLGAPVAPGAVGAWPAAHRSPVTRRGPLPRARGPGTGATGGLEHPPHLVEEVLRGAQRALGVLGVDRVEPPRVDRLPQRGPGGEERGPRGGLGCDGREHVPHRTRRAAPTRPAVRGDHRGRGPQGGQVRVVEHLGRPGGELRGEQLGIGSAQQVDGRGRQWCGVDGTAHGWHLLLQCRTGVRTSQPLPCPTVGPWLDPVAPPRGDRAEHPTGHPQTPRGCRTAPSGPRPGPSSSCAAATTRTA